MNKEFRLATGDEIRGALEHGDQVYVMLDTESAATPVLSKADAQPVAYAVFADNGNIRIWSTSCEAVGIKVMQEEGKEAVPLYTRSDAGEAERLSTVIEQQKNLIASLRAELRDSYSIDAAVQEEHLDLEAAAKKLAACMDYPWEHMPEQGRASMREHATAVIGAALNPVKSGASA